MSRLYHRQVFWHKSFDALAEELFNKNYSLHLFEHLLYSTDKKYAMTMRELDRIIDELINHKRYYFLYEIETKGNDDIIKCAIRTSYDLDRDISIVFAISKNNKNIVKTAWLNKKNDWHFSLDKSKYYKPQRRAK